MAIVAAENKDSRALVVKDPNIPRGQFVPSRKESTPGNEFSKTTVETELRIANTEEVVILPVQISTTVWDVKETLADKLGIDPVQLTFVTKQGVYWREQNDCEEIARKVLIRGIRSFTRARKEYPHPIVIIGTGHLGLRQAMIFHKYQQHNFVIFDKKPRVGGQSWWDQANTTSKLQTELGVYHLDWDENIPIPVQRGDYPWPARNDLLKHFEEMAEQYGIMPHCRMSTCVKEMVVNGKGEDSTFELTLKRTDEKKSEEQQFMASAIMMYPGNLSLPRREEYVGEDEFLEAGGKIAYGMFDEFDYKECTGKTACIIGHGAFAVENIRTCLEYNAKKLYLVCRRKNLSCPRFTSWMCNQSGQPVPASLFLNMSKPMYDLVGFEPWEYHSVQSNTARTTCQIIQKARFGIGDVYFMAISWGKLEVIEDPIGVKRLGPLSLHNGNGRVIDVDVILKLLGFVGNPENDRLLRIKEMVGFWVNDDPKRYLVAEPISVMATNFGGTSFSPGAIAWANQGMWFIHHPKDFYNKILPTGFMPRHKADGDDRPAYVVDARHGTQTMIFVSAVIPFLAERGAIEGPLKIHRMWTLHPIDRFIQLCKEDWNYYTARFETEGLSGPEYPYTPEVAHHWLDQYKQESELADKKQMQRMGIA